MQSKLFVLHFEIILNIFEFPRKWEIIESWLVNVNTHTHKSYWRKTF